MVRECPFATIRGSKGDDTMTDEAPLTEAQRLEAAKQRVAAKKAFFGHALVFIIINVVGLIVVGEDWLWVTLFWGLGLAAQAFTVFFRESAWLKDWEHKQVQKEMARTDPNRPAPAPKAPPAPPAPPAPEVTTTAEAPAAPATTSADETQQ